MEVRLLSGLQFGCGPVTRKTPGAMHRKAIFELMAGQTNTILQFWGHIENQNLKFQPTGIQSIIVQL